MNMKKIVAKYYILLFLLLPFISAAQKFDNTAIFRDIKSDTYIRLYYDNDFFTNSDYYYTQGYNVEFISPRLNKNPINKVFPKAPNKEQKFGISIEHFGFTPTSIASDSILYGDRPFSAAIMIKSFLISTDTLQKTRWSAAMSIGLIGPNAFGKEIQTDIHRWIGDETPHGWQYQIRNDWIINYELSYEKQWYRFNDIIALNSNAKLRFGSFNTSVTAGYTLLFGKINTPFTTLIKQNTFQIYGYCQSLGSLIAYDATLQGGLFNPKSSYYLTDAQMNRLTLQTNFGMVLQYRRYFLEYAQTMLTKEFKSGNNHNWGGFRIGLKL